MAGPDTPGPLSPPAADALKARWTAPVPNDADALRKALEDERRARANLERLLAARTEELANASAETRVLSADFERRVETRTAELTMARELAAEAQRRTAEIALEAEQAAITKNKFLARMAHEIRTPLSAIAGYASLIADNGAAAASTQTPEWARNLKRSAEYLQSLVADILDLSQIQGGEATLELGPVSVERLMSEVASIIAQSAAPRGLAFGLRFETSMPEVITTDVVRLRQILLHLGSNAVKFTQSGGVELRARLLSMSDASGRGSLELEVRDTGIGIANDGIERIFEPFAQVHGDRETYGGAGLGLHITRRLVQWLGGYISVTSNPRVGSCFRVTLPIQPHEMGRQVDSRQTSRPVGEPPAKTAQPLVGCRVLVVDDSQEIGYVLRVILQRAGAQVECAFSGEAGLEAVAQAKTPFDVVLLDLQLPGISGVETAVRMKQRGDSPRAIIALTANANPEAQRASLQAGCDDFLVKPVPAAHLQATIVTLLRRTEPARGASNPQPTLTFPAPVPSSPAPASSTAPSSSGAQATPAASGLAVTAAPNGAGVPPAAPDPTLEREAVDIPEELHRSYLGFLGRAREELLASLDVSRLGAANDLAPLRRLAHKLAGSGGSFGYPAITHYARRVEALAARDMPDDLLVAMRKLLAAMESALANAAKGT